MAKFNKSKDFVAIDAGHGSQTAGKRTPDGHKEHWINVRTAYYLERLLKDNGIKTFRVGWDDTNSKDDTDVSLTVRQNQVRKKGCYLLVSCHANAYGSGWNSANGVETLVHSVAGKRGNSVSLANKIQKQIVKGTKQSNRGVKYQYLAMCDCAAMKVKAAALVEIGFMTNKTEASLMKTEAFCKEQGEEIAKGIMDYLGIKYTVKKTGIVLAGAMHDENKQYKGGEDGDQLQTSSTNDTKGEVRFRDFHIHAKGWYGFIFVSDEHADRFIKEVIDGINNPFIGYDQDNRYDIMDMAKKYGSLKDIAEPTECVCSSLFRAAIYLATGIDLGPFLTGDMPELFEKSGLFKEKVVVTSEDDVEDGMILVTKTSGHTEAVVSGRTRSKGFKEYKVKVTAKTLNVRKGAGTKNKVVGVITADEKLIKKNPNYYFKKTTYTIIEEKMVGSNKWGRLKSDAGWIHLGYTKKV